MKQNLLFINSTQEEILCNIFTSLETYTILFIENPTPENNQNLQNILYEFNNQLNTFSFDFKITMQELIIELIQILNGLPITQIKLELINQLLKKLVDYSERFLNNLLIESIIYNQLSENLHFISNTLTINNLTFSVESEISTLQKISWNTIKNKLFTANLFLTILLIILLYLKEL
ncbi:hypothetical protein [Bacillus sp. FSL R12-0069]|uniref:hypothetical protein n=1 Tax=Bacillus sp. FSL R12-0069 TaxID=2975342 RepID=UPI0030F5D2C3